MNVCMTPEEIVDEFCLFDDTFMSRVFEKNVELTRWLLQLIFEKDDIELTEVIGQCNMKNLVADGREIDMDIFARDILAVTYNVEVQRANEGASDKRARFHSANLDVRMLKKNEDFKQLKDSYMIFITEKDVKKKGLPIYHVERCVKEDGEDFEDGSHIIYVNGAYEDVTTNIGKLAHDFKSKNPDEMYFKELADAVRYYKHGGGREKMCQLVEDYAVYKAREANERADAANERAEAERKMREEANERAEAERKMREAANERAEAAEAKILELQKQLVALQA